MQEPQPEVEGHRSPFYIACICKLCECGSHECGSFTRVKRSLHQKHQNAKLALEDAYNRCSSQNEVPNHELPPMASSCKQADEQHQVCRCLEAYQNERYLMHDDELEQPEPQEEPHQTVAMRRGRSCHSNLADYNRKPGAGETRSMVKSKSRASYREPLEPELLQTPLKFVAIRPQLASKPRDNIMFEGEMDLTTTFESSYEALAKLRLEHWKEYQRNLKQQQEQRGRTRQRRSVASTGAASKTEEADQPKPEVDPNSNQQKNSHHPEPSSRPQPQATPKPRSQPKAADVSADAKHGGDIELGDRRPLQASELATEVSSSRPPRQPKSAQPFIDPDLSPLIVFDSNLNRLERVGTRKRSKYRPSTSLRSGAGGMFGDNAHHDAGALDPKPLVVAATSQEQPSNDLKQSQTVDEPKTAQPEARKLDQTALVHDQDERDAVAEIQRATGAGSAGGPATATPASAPKSLQDPKEHRLHRTCQQKSFDIFSRNEYPEMALDSKTTPTSIARSPIAAVNLPETPPVAVASDQQQQQQLGRRVGGSHYNNLFRESPDFTLHHNKHLHHGADDAAAADTPTDSLQTQQQVTTGSRLQHSDSADTANSMSVIWTSPLDSDCRVSDINSRFRYVGSQSGHKFFVERNRDSEEATEIGAATNEQQPF